ncbi:MAG: hypothetical protein ACTHM9_01150 [Gemmatimonadales bacterium]|jgi:hypothetical protein
MSARVSRRRSSWPRTVGVALLAACHTWRTQPVSPADVLATSPSEVRLHLHDGRRVVVRRPALRADTVVSQLPNDTVAMALTEVDSAALRKGDTAKTMGLVLLIVGVPALLCAVGCEVPDYGIALPTD